MSDPKPPLKVLTLWPEWAYAVAHLGKDVENRTWRRPPRLPEGQMLAIHAGRLIGGQRGGAEAAVDLVEETATHALKRPVLVAREEIETGCIVALASVVAVTYDAPSPWSVEGAWQLVFGEVATLTTPIPCKGAQGLWRPSPEIVAQLRSEWPSAKRRRCRVP